MIYSSENDEAQAFHHFIEAHKLLPTNLNTIAWLGIFYVKNCNFKKASYYFSIAAKTNPKDLKWKLMIASCHRRMEKYDEALELYKEVYETDNDNLEALRFIGNSTICVKLINSAN
jgi:intraflagellar transport protein 88